MNPTMLVLSPHFAGKSAVNALPGKRVQPSERSQSVPFALPFHLERKLRGKNHGYATVLQRLLCLENRLSSRREQPGDDRKAVFPVPLGTGQKDPCFTISKRGVSFAVAIPVRNGQIPNKANDQDRQH